MGRKKKNNYFGKEEEEAVVKFISSDSFDERNEIYNKTLRPAIEKMTESIIRRYKLFSKSETYEDVHADTISYLMLKADKFKPSQNKKAYSYYGTICKNYLIHRLIKETKKTNKHLQFEAYHNDDNDESDLSYETGYDNVGIEYSKLISYIKDKIADDIKENHEEMLDCEVMVGNCIIEILDNREFFLREEKNNKYNKNVFYYSVREYTGLQTKDIRNGLKRFKHLYQINKETLLKNGIL